MQTNVHITYENSLICILRFGGFSETYGQIVYPYLICYEKEPLFCKYQTLFFALLKASNCQTLNSMMLKIVFCLMLYNRVIMQTFVLINI